MNQCSTAIDGVWMDIKIGIAAHKQYWMPETDIYLPIQVGAAGKEDLGYTRDDCGQNISKKNPQFCELTALYWMWKNLEADYCGLVHYRRHFVNPHVFLPKIHPYAHILDRDHLETLLADCDIILPKMRNYYIESIYSHYAHSHYAEHLDRTREILSRDCPEYLDSFDRVMQGTTAHMFNMMIMKKELLEAYCSWMFPVIFELEKVIDSSEYDAFQGRFPGRISELLLDVWVDRNQYSYKELPVMMLGKVHWGRKIKSFLAAKFLGKRYKQGF